MSEYISLLNLVVAILTLIVACLALFFAWRIPHQIMVNQCYSDLISKYNSYEMGEAIRAIFDFYKYCCNKKLGDVREQYRRRYCTDFPEKVAVGGFQCPQLVENSHKKYCLDCRIYGNKDNLEEKTEGKSKREYNDTLHAQRRLIDQFFWFIGDLVFGTARLVRLPKCILRSWFTCTEHELLAIILKMDEAEEIVKKHPSEPIPRDADTIETYQPAKNPKNDGLMWDIRKRLYAESQHWKKN